jgi:transaldolase
LLHLRRFFLVILTMLYLDSAQIKEAKAIRDWGWVKGITTNPTLLAQSDRDPETTLRELADLSSGELFYQLTATDLEAMILEGRQAYDLIGRKTVLKIPATETGFLAVAHLSCDIDCAVTAIYSAAQAAVAQEAGAKYAIAYVNRATRLLGDGLALVTEMAQVLKKSSTQILAASIKSPEEAAATLQAGAHHLTLQLPILRAITTHPLSEQTVLDFNQNGAGLTLKSDLF